jgi:hypothetical protein
MEAPKEIIDSLSEREAAAFKLFVKLCDDRALLCRPVSLDAVDVCDGLNDAATLL